jgi:hypothetical protein
MDSNTRQPQWASLFLVASLIACPIASADVVTDWNIKAGEIVVEARLPAPAAARVVAIIQTAVYETANAITKRYPASRLKLEAASGASIDAAVAAANRATMVKLVASQQATIETAYQAALSKVADGPAKTAGVAVGEQAAAAILAWAADDGAVTGESYRPLTTAGVYVPTVVPVASQWPAQSLAGDCPPVPSRPATCVDE